MRKLSSKEKISLQHKTNNLLNADKKKKGKQIKSVYLIPEYNHILYIKNDIKNYCINKRKTFHFLNRLYTSIKLYKNSGNMMQHKNNKEAIVVSKNILYKLFGHNNFQKVKDSLEIYFDVKNNFKVGVDIIEKDTDDLFSETIIKNNYKGIAKEWFVKDIPFFDIVYVDHKTRKKFDELIYNIVNNIEFKKSLLKYKKLFNENKNNILHLTEEQRDEINFIHPKSDKNQEEIKDEFVIEKILHIENIKEELYNKLLKLYKNIRVNENYIRKLKNQLKNIKRKNDECLDYNKIIQYNKSINIIEHKIKSIKSKNKKIIKFIDNVKLFLIHSNEHNIVFNIKEKKGRYYSIFTNVSKDFRKWFNEKFEFYSFDIKNSIPNTIKTMKEIFNLKTEITNIEFYAKNRDELFKVIINENKSRKLHTNSIKKSLKETFITALNAKENYKVRFKKIKESKSKNNLKRLLEKIQKEGLELRKELNYKKEFIYNKLKELNLIESKLNLNEINEENSLMIFYFYIEKYIINKIENKFFLNQLYRVHDNISIDSKLIKEKYNSKEELLKEINNFIKKFNVELDLE